MKKISIISFLLITLLSLGGCFNFSGEEETETTTIDETSSLYETSEFSITVPTDWETIDKNDFTSEVEDEAQVLFRNNIKNETFTANVIILKKNLLETVETSEYANLVKNRQKGLVDFKEIQKEESKILIGDSEISTYFVIFEARKGTNEKLIRYQQTYGVKDKYAYIITGSTSPNENESTVKKVENIVRSFKLN